MGGLGETPSPTPGTQPAMNVQWLNLSAEVGSSPQASEHWEGALKCSTPFQGGQTASTPQLTHSDDRKQAQVRLSRNCQWKTSFWAKHGPGLWRRADGRWQRAISTIAAWPGAPWGPSAHLSSWALCWPWLLRELSHRCPEAPLPFCCGQHRGQGITAELGQSWGPDWQVLL